MVDESVSGPKRVPQKGPQFPKLPEIHTVPRKGEGEPLIRQLSAARDGINSCVPTQALNALIGLGKLSTEQAEVIQDSFATDLKDMFSPINKGTTQEALVFNQSVGSFLGRLDPEVTKGVHVDAMDVSTMDHADAKGFVLRQLQENKLIIGGDSDHAVLLYGFEASGDTLRFFDSFTTRAGLFETNGFTQGVREGQEPWITMLSEKTIS